MVPTDADIPVLLVEAVAFARGISLSREVALVPVRPLLTALCSSVPPYFHEHVHLAICGSGSSHHSLFGGAQSH
jgi:hypothetical protein